METTTPALVVAGTLHKELKKGRATLRGRSGKSLWFQKQGARLYYVSKRPDNSVELNENNAKGFISCEDVLGMFEVKGELVSSKDHRQLELLTTKGRLVLNFPLDANVEAWMNELQAHITKATTTSPRSGRKYTMEDVPRSGSMILPSAKGGELEEESKKRGTLGNFIRSKTSRRKRSSSDKERKDKGDDEQAGDDDEAEGNPTTIMVSGRKRPQLPFSFRSNPKEKASAPAGGGVQLISTFSSGAIPSDIRSMLAGLGPSNPSAVSPRGSPATSAPPSSEGQPSAEPTAEDSTSASEESGKKGSDRKARPLVPAPSVVDSPKLVHAATAPYSPATMYAQVVKESSTATSKVLFLPGEDLKAGIRNVLILLRGIAESSREGSLYITNYRLLWRNPANRNDSISIPFRCIKNSELSANQECVFIECADFRILEIYCKGPAGMHPDKKRILQYEDQKTLRRELKAHLAGQTTADLFAFQNKERFESLEAEVKGWPIFEIRVEAARWKLPLEKWQFVENTKFKLSPTYPPYILLPSFLSKKATSNSFDAHHEKRILALCWKDSQSDTQLLFRSAIPRQYTLVTDIARVMSYPTIHLFHIFHPADKKGGLAGVVENEHHADASDEHSSVIATKEEVTCDDEHVNVVQLELPSAVAVGLSFTRLRKAVSDISFITPNDRENWVPALKATRWLHYMRRLIDVVAKGVSVLNITKEPLVIQNIDGSNCVPQITSLIQICMDPFYRTFEGFSVLVEKEWISFSHNFGQSPKKANSKEVKKSKDKANMAHMFVQFMDGVWQLWSQFPRSFQFSESYLLFILDSLYSARFGTFLGNNFKQRHKHKLASSTVSLWSYLYAHRDSYRNPLYQPPSAKSSLSNKTLTVAPLLVKFWSGYFLQHQCKDTLRHCSLIIDAALGPRGSRVDDAIPGPPSSASSGGRSSSPGSSLTSSRTPTSASPMTECDDFLLSSTESPPSLSASPSSTDGESLASTVSASPTAISEQTAGLTYMSSLSLARKGLHMMPNELADDKDRRFARLRQLDLSSNILSYFAFLVAHYGKLEVLNLSDNEFREVPELLAQSFVDLTQLRELDISNNKIYHLPAQLSLLTNLRRLEASHNRLLFHKQQQEIDQIGVHESMSSVQRRTLDSFDFASLADSLEYLSISYNFGRRNKSSTQRPNHSTPSSRYSLSALSSPDLHQFPRSIMALTNLVSLKFHGNNISYLPSNFFSTFKRLKELDMGNNAITILPSGLGGLQLTSLNLNNIELKELIPPDLFQLGGSLRQLHAQGLRLLKVPTGFSALTALEMLDLSNNDLTTFPESLLQLTNLQHLLLSQNNINALPTGIKHLKNLEKLYLDKNDLHSLIPEIGFCKALGVLNISDNKIKELPPQLGALPHLRRLIIGKNMPLVSPPINVEAEGEEAVLSFIKQFINGFERCFRYKLMVVGQENVGKSSLLRCLNSHRAPRKGEAMPNLSTDGIEIGTAEWTIKVVRENEAKEVTLTTWDFAGQEVYYSTHHLFLTERSLFLLVTDVSKPLEFSRLDFWLESIRSRTKNAHVIVVGTHIDDKICTSEHLETKEKEIKAKFFARYSNIHSLCFISCATGKNMSSLMTKIEEVLAGEIHLGEFLPKSYLELERMIIQQRKNRVQDGLPPIALWSEYKSWAELCMISNEKELLVATTFLHNLGSLLYFAEDENLRDVVILDPQWLASIMSTIITTKHNYLGREGYEGILQHSILPFIWRPPAFPNDLHGFFLYLLNKFEIAFTLEEGEEGDDDDEEDQANEEGNKRSILAFLPTVSSSPSLPLPDKTVKRLSRLSTSAPLSPPELPLETGSRSRAPSLITSAPPEIGGAVKDSAASTGPVLKRKTTRELLSELINRPIARKLKNKGYSLVPALLPNKRPDDLASVWPLRREGDGILEYGRIYTFDFAPTGFFAKVMVRLLSFRLPQILKYWRNGLLLSSGFEKVFVEFNPTLKVLTVSIRAEDKDLPKSSPTRFNLLNSPVKPRSTTVAVANKHNTTEEKPGKTKDKHWTLKRKGSKKGQSSEKDQSEERLELTDDSSKRVVRTISERGEICGESESETATEKEASIDASNGQDAPATGAEEDEQSLPRFQLLSLLVFSTIDALIRDWFKLQAQITVPCPHCIAANLPNPSTFSFTELQRALVRENDSAYIICNNVGKFGFAQLIRIDRLVPDVAMLHLDDAKIEYSEITIDEEIGSGGFAELYKGKWRDEVVAVKKFKFTEDETLSPEEILQALEEFRQEVWIMGGLHHPNIVGLRAFCMDPCCIVEELVTGGNMLSYLHSPAPLEWPLRLKMLKDIAKGCAFLHSTTPPIMHRDLKTPNILLVSTAPDAELVAKVCDFGVSINSSSAALGRKVDCPLWLAPEVMMGMPYTGKADVYSFGVICWESITRKRFFDNVSFMSMIESKVIAGERPSIPTDVYPEFAELIEACWHQDPNKRPTFVQVVERLAQMMIQYCPDQAQYDKEVAAKEEALEKQRQERNRQYRLQKQKEEEIEEVEEDETLGNEQQSKDPVTESEAIPATPAKQQRKWVQRRRGPSLSVLQDKSSVAKPNGSASSISAESRKAMLDQLRKMSAKLNRRLPHTLAVELPSQEEPGKSDAVPQQVENASSTTSAIEGVSGLATPRPGTSDESVNQIPLTPRAKGADVEARPAEDQTATPVSSSVATTEPLLPDAPSPQPSTPTDPPRPPPMPSIVIVDSTEGTRAEGSADPVVVAIPSLQEDEAKIKEKEDRKRRVEEIRQRTMIRGNSALGGEQPGEVRRLPPRPASMKTTPHRPQE